MFFFSDIGLLIEFYPLKKDNVYVNSFLLFSHAFHTIFVLWKHDPSVERGG